MGEALEIEVEHGLHVRAPYGPIALYTEAQLVGFRSGARANNGPMVAIADRLSDKEIKAVADYVAGLR